MTKKNYEARIKLSREEHEKIKKKADKLGMSLSGFGRFLLLSSTIKATTEQDYT